MSKLIISTAAALFVFGTAVAFAQPMPGAQTQQRENDRKDQEMTTGIPRNQPTAPGLMPNPSRADQMQQSQGVKKDQEMTTGIPGDTPKSGGMAPNPSATDLIQQGQGVRKDREQTTGTK